MQGFKLGFLSVGYWRDHYHISGVILSDKIKGIIAESRRDREIFIRYEWAAASGFEQSIHGGIKG